PPTLEVTQLPTIAGNQVNVTCQVGKFYPQRLNLTWLENGNVSRTESASTLVENKDGTYNWTSWLLVNSSAHREDVVLTCQVQHDGQPAVSRSHTLEVSAQQKEQGTDTNVELTGESISYRISSTAQVVLAPGDVRSQVICEVAHITLQGGPPLRGTASLSETIR
ncbi:PREDICTED: signal-regulatory protein beta-1 isoform 3-like, partial [Galeopterus variegatus]|uniref:Signal-regulatory protein beta-1 isoform 3-like n=1 Tax=Galeopterus variegatus TaxID=482537 RepID=A0ABM0Q4X9_GALVR